MVGIVRTREKISRAAILLVLLFLLGTAGATKVAASRAPRITTQPASQTLTAGQTGTFTVAATGTGPLSYQWQKNGVNIAGATSSSYTTPATTSANSGSTYDVVVSNSVGSATSNAATLTVTVIAGTYTLMASSSALSFSWQTGSTTPVAQTVKVMDNSPNCENITIVADHSWLAASPGSGCTAPLMVSVSINTAGLTAGSYSGNIIIAGSTELNSPFAIPVTLIVSTTSAPAITTQPASQTVTAGQTATFTVAATGAAPMTYQWQKNSVNISGATSSSYATAATTTGNSGSTYDVVVTNAAGTVTSASATLTVNAAAVAPTITTQPVSQTVTAGQIVTFTVAATGTASLSYQWQKNSVNISGATSSSYTTPVTTTGNSGSTYDVVVTNAAGTVTSVLATLTVNAAAVAPTITAQPASQTVTAGQTGTFTVAATGTAPMSYQWQKNSVNIAGATSSSYTTPATTSANSGSTYDVVVSNSVGSATSSAATLIVTAAANAGTYTLGASPSALSFSWQTGSAVPVAQTVKVMDNSPNCENITIAADHSWLAASPGSGCTAPLMVSVSINTAGLTAGSYSGNVIVTGSTELNSPFAIPVTLTVSTTSAPAITTQPASQTVTAGQTATFTVAATGAAPMTYQWQKSGVNISGATSSSYTTPVTSTGNSGSTYDVVVTNSAGTVTSASATLTVNAAATLVLNASPTTVAFGNVTLPNSSTQNITLTNSGSSPVTISNVMIAGPGFNASGGNGVILSAGQTTTITATFDPSTAGSAAGTLTVTSNATNSPTTITLSGTGVAAAAHSVSLNWQASTSSVIGYNVYSTATVGGTLVKLTPTPIAATSYTDNTVQAGVTYYYAVTSVGTDGVESADSTEVSALVP